MKRALVVRENVFFVPALLDWLESEQLEVITTQSGVTGLEIVESLKPTVVVVIVSDPAPAAIDPLQGKEAPLSAHLLHSEGESQAFRQMWAHVDLALN